MPGRIHPGTYVTPSAPSEPPQKPHECQAKGYPAPTPAGLSQRQYDRHLA